MKIGETKTYYFPDNDIHVVVERFPNGDYGAWRIDLDDGKPVQAWGSTILEAIAELYEATKETAS